MDTMVQLKSDNQAASEYYDLYLSIRTALREGKMEISEAEAYLAYKELLLTKKAKKLAQEMIKQIKE
ncbi:hypothetical protein SAMN05421493_10186 [Pseudobutyrivibrio sp. 49]|uniref:hypothetical protein n=1 Tax=Pseudobutyrivibrio sp. 49 TaxID=1855344 RepID=UPI00088D8FDD|nr:hypothetical protein [Pseudobutyrivibrio sp. 49]SDH27689.1 hypothetical protein SAMN05421493_10186 [Pseudobutyrivibrio sp. 49]